MITGKTKIATWNIIIPIIMLLLLELLIRILVPEIQLPGLDRKFLEDSLYYSSPGLKRNSSGLSNGISKRVGSDGFWELFPSKSENLRRKILILGDSATMGIGVANDSTYAGLLNSFFEDAIVLNAALIGYSSKDYLNIVDNLVIGRKTTS